MVFLYHHFKCIYVTPREHSMIVHTTNISDVIKHDRDFCYSPKSQSPSSRRPMTAIHPEPRKRIPTPKIAKDDLDRQLEAIEKSLEYAKAESLSKAIRESQSPGQVVEVDGTSEKLPGSDEEELKENSNTPSPESSHSNSTIDDFVDQLEQQGNASTRPPHEDPILSLQKSELLATGASAADPSANTLSDSSNSIEEALLFETADEVCCLDISNLELTSVSQIPDNEEDANTFYSFEDFEEEAPQTPLEELESPIFTDAKLFKRASSLDLKSRKSAKEFLNRSLPLNSNSDPMANFNLSDISDLHLSDISQSSDLDRSISHVSQSSEPGASPIVDRSDPNISNTSNKSDYTKSSTIVLRSDRIRSLRAKCEERLGASLFNKIYRYLEDARYGEYIVPEEIIVSTLRSWVPEFTSDCFSVDQLIYLEKQEMLASHNLDLL